MITARARLDELFARVDAFFDRTAASFPGPGGVTCHAGCTDCCRRFSVTRLEAEAIAEGLSALPAATRAALAARAAEETDVCPALDPDGRCAVYAFRPVICRTHGLPIRFASDPETAIVPLARLRERGRPEASAVLDACPRNFQGHDLGALPPGAVLDQTTLSTVLAALDAAHAAESGGPRGERVAVATLLGAT